MRLKGMYVEDPRVKRNLFVEAGRMGDIDEVVYTIHYLLSLIAYR